MKAPTTYQLMILKALQDKPIYEGTVPRDVIADRRAKGRAARRARKRNRR